MRTGPIMEINTIPRPSVGARFIAPWGGEFIPHAHLNFSTRFIGLRWVFPIPF